MKFQLGRKPCKVTAEKKDGINTDEKKDTPFAQVGLVRSWRTDYPRKATATVLAKPASDYREGREAGSKVSTKAEGNKTEDCHPHLPWSTSHIRLTSPCLSTQKCSCSTPSITATFLYTFLATIGDSDLYTDQAALSSYGIQQPPLSVRCSQG